LAVVSPSSKPKISMMDVDSALTQAWDLGMEEAGSNDAVIEEAERLLPALLSAGYAAAGDDADTWWFTREGVARAEQLTITGHDQ
jgi:hypothetical protein